MQLLASIYDGLSFQNRSSNQHLLSLKFRVTFKSRNNRKFEKESLKKNTQVGANSKTCRFQRFSSKNSSQITQKYEGFYSTRWF